MQLDDNKRSNCYNLIRIIAAFQVFYGHATAHLSLNMPTAIGYILSIIPGVPTFFLISGFLIWQSIDRTGYFGVFARKRIARLYPELWGGVIASVICILILYRDQLKIVPFIAWIVTQSTVFQFWTPDCLRGYGCGTPNGALWTIGVMVQCYIVMWVFHKAIKGQKFFVWLISLGVGIFFNIFIPICRPHLPEIVYKLVCQTFIPYFWIFIMGAMISEYFDRLIEGMKKYWPGFLVLSSLVNYTKIDAGIYGTLSVLFIAPAIIGFAYRYPGFNIKTDITYGFYIYHMAVINVMIELGFMGKIVDLLIALVLSSLLGIFSYYTIGRFSRAQRKKLTINENV